MYGEFTVGLLVVLLIIFLAKHLINNAYASGKEDGKSEMLDLLNGVVKDQVVEDNKGRRFFVSAAGVKRNS